MSVAVRWGEMGEYGIDRKDGWMVRNVFHWEEYWYSLKHGNLIRVVQRVGCDLKFCGQRVVRGYSDRDVWDMKYWFLEVVPDMLRQLKDTKHGSPAVLGEERVDEMGRRVNDSCHAEWDTILERLVFLFHEADEETCVRKNPMEERHREIRAEFKERYGELGEGIEVKGEKREMRRLHFPDEIPEYEEAERSYWEEERKLEEYRNECKEEAFRLFSKWFWHLWD